MRHWNRSLACRTLNHCESRVAAFRNRRRAASPAAAAVANRRYSLRWAAVDQSLLNYSQDCGGDGSFCSRQLRQCRACPIENLDVVVSRVHGGGPIEDDQIAAFALQLREGSKSLVVRLQRKANEPLSRAFFRTESRHNIGRFHKMKLEWQARLGNLLLFDFDR